MVVYIDVPHVAARYSIQTPYQLMKFINQRLPERNITFGEAKRLLESRKRSYFKNDTLDQLCEVFNCEPGEFYKRIKGKPTR